MWVSTHVLAGLAIVALIGGPWWLVLIAVVLAHVLMDLIPHWDYTKSQHPTVYIWCDVAASTTAWLLAWLVLGMPFWMALMGPLSGSPDLDVLVAMIRGKEVRKYFPSHWDRFPHGCCGPVPGIAVQVVFMAISVILVTALQPY